MSSKRFAIGIDLGTTHCALSFVDNEHSEGEEILQGLLPIPQLTAPGTVEHRPLLPSFLYLPHPDEFDPTDLDLPWAKQTDRFAGELARNLGASTPLRLVFSAKSWLCHPDVDRRAPILPAGAPNGIPQVSPLEASAFFLGHLRDAWNRLYPSDPLTEQEVTVTVPASFDPAARELTAEAARRVGITDLVLLEEPQAALYAWVNASRGDWRNQVRLGDVILVVDVGGGTTDMSLIAVTERDGVLELTRIAVGDHILLGGDNMDLALAHLVKGKLDAVGVELDRWQLLALTHGCRQAKERLLGEVELSRVPVVVPSRGTQLVGGSIRTELTRDEVMTVLMTGFFPEVPITARPADRVRTALTKLGLPFAHDPGITRHLAAFLSRQSGATADLADFVEPAADADFLHPTAVLFNGGVFKSPVLRERVIAVINGWLMADGAPPARQLETQDLDLSVAQGAAFYAHVRRRGGVRIRGGTARSYYVGIESAGPAVPGLEPPLQLLCLVPFGLEEGSEPVVAPQEFGLIVGEPVRFRFFGSSVRRDDQVGLLIEDWPAHEIEELEEIQTTLPTGSRRRGDIVAVNLQAAVTEVGTLELVALSRQGSERWKVEFNTRGAD
ncbi:Hsp70 family protein [Thioalkalicoccus limnaeus]|uniref:Hsp70 family protein n=1 Tax=Thioalkalicoccus limnaeus TaxID=120681 RepID=A0ABV4BCZ5_9GAMM